MKASRRTLHLLPTFDVARRERFVTLFVHAPLSGQVQRPRRVRTAALGVV